MTALLRAGLVYRLAKPSGEASAEDLGARCLEEIGGTVSTARTTVPDMPDHLCAVGAHLIFRVYRAAPVSYSRACMS